MGHVAQAELDVANTMSPNPRSVARISVEKLFGQFTYDLPTRAEDRPDLSQLLILYGDNGSGKTTLLKLLFDLLSPEGGKGYKTEAAKVRFKRFAVELRDGTTVEALRTGKSLEGPYRAAVLKGAKTIDAVDFHVDSSGRSAPDDETKAHQAQFLQHLSNLGISSRFLSDDRRIQGQSMEEEDRASLRWSTVLALGTKWRDPPRVEEERPAGIVLKRAVDRAVQWFADQAFQGSNTGQQNVHSIYSEIAKSIAESPAVDPTNLRQRVDELVGQLKELSDRSADYARFGLASKLTVDSMQESLRNAEPETLPALYNVLVPYVRSIEARLKALHGIHSLLETFLANINAFFGETKRVEFDVRRGLSIRSRRDEELDLEMLSSGEKQLLLLLCDAAAARERASILIIDEPEISLNIKWQRQLVQALLDCIRGSNVQLIFATHSIELLARHRSHVVKLVDTADVEHTSRPHDQPIERRRKADDRRVGHEV
jgi:energy-coupling factor transporter ATP-binding protein EcfA2